MIHRQPAWAKYVDTYGVFPKHYKGTVVMAVPFFMEKILQVAAELGALHALIETGQLKPYLKKSEAFRLYGRNRVEHWIGENAIKPHKDGNHSAAWRIDRMEIALLAAANELLPYL